MFVLPTDKGQRIEQALAQRVCTSEDGSYIRRSNGRRRAGRPAKYTVHLSGDTSFVVEAFDDGTAVELANKRQANKSVQRTGTNCLCGGSYYTDKVQGVICCRCQSPRR